MTDAAPRFSLVVDASGAPPHEVEKTISSALTQTAGRWELLLHGAEAGSSPRAAAAPEDARVRVLSISGSARHRVQEALGLARGEFVTFMDAGEEFAVDHALDTLERLAETTPDLDLAYTDEVVIDERGAPLETIRKPLWSPERLLGQPWLGRLTVLRSSMVLSACRELDLAEAWEDDLLLRAGERARHIERVPELLFHSRRTAVDPALDGRRVDVVREHLSRVGVRADVRPGNVAGTCRVTREVPEDLSVAVIVPSRGEKALAWGMRRWCAVEAARSVLHRAGHHRVEVVVVHTTPVDQSLLDALLALGERVRLIPFSGPFSPPEMANLGVLSTASDVVVVMDEHTEVVSDDFVTELVGPLNDAGIGLTGPRLLSSNGSLLNAGLAFHRHRVQPMFPGQPADDVGPGALLAVSHECSGLGGGCLALRRATFDQVGGLNPRMAVTYDVDLSFKVRHAGLRRVWVPTATAYDLSSRFKVPAIRRSERVMLRGRWLAPELDEYAPIFGAWRAARDRAELSP